MTKGIIYFIREPRCGGTFCESFIRDTKREEYDFYTTHNMDEIKNVPKDSIVIRCARKNYTEQFLSIMAIDLLGTSSREFTNFTYEKPYNPIFEKIRNSKVTIKKNEAIDWVQGKIELEMMIDQYVDQLKYQIIFYEDMFKPFDIPILDLYNIDFSSVKQYTYRLPDYKREVFTNYDQIEKWIEKTKNAYIKKYNLEKLFEHWTSDSSS